MERTKEELEVLGLRSSRKDFLDSWELDFPLFSAECLWIEPKSKPGQRPQPLLCEFNPSQDHIFSTIETYAKLDSYIRALTLKARQVGSTTYWLCYAVWLCLFRPGSRVVIVSQAELTSKDLMRKVKFMLSRLPPWMRRMARFQCWPKTEYATFANGSIIRSGTANSEYWRSSTMDMALLTEATSYDDLAGTMKAILPACYGPAVIESTAKGLGLFKDMWEDTNAAWTKVFISWLLDPSCQADSRLQDPTAEDRQYIDQHKLTEKQANWYINTKWSTFAGNQRDFDQEHPATPELAFSMAGDRFFRRRIFQYNPADIPKQDLVWYAEPIEGHKYALGADVGMGHLDGDASTGVLLDITDPSKVTVAAVLQCWHQTPLFADELVKIAKKVQAAHAHLMAVVETNVGLDVVRALKKARVRQYSRIEFKKKYEDWPDEYGFHTTAQSRPILMAALSRYVLGDRLADLRDPRLMAECNTFIYNDKGKPEAAAGKHDDLVMALALALQAIDELASMSTPPPLPPIPPRPLIPLLAVQWDMEYGHLFRR